MTEYLFENNASSTLVNAIGGGDNSLILASASAFPSPGAGQAFYVLVRGGGNQEWMYISGRSGNTLTASRVEANSFPAGSVVELVLGKVVLDNFIQKAVERTYAGSPDGVLAAQYVGEEVLDSVNEVWYKHITGTTWKS